MANAPSISAFLRNMRAYLPQRLMARAGMFVINPTAFDQPNIHSIKRLNDRTQNTFQRVYGAGTKLYVGEGTAAVDTGYSGNPLALLTFRPDQSPQPWMYVGDSNKMSKVRVDGLVHSVGMQPPLGAPTIGFGPDVFQKISSFDAVGSWTPGGTAGAISVVARMNTTIAVILYDAGGNGFASIQPTAFTDSIEKGMLIEVGAGGTKETILVYDVYQPFAPTTIQSIAYDSGTSGLCTIQPTVATVAGNKKPLPPKINPPKFKNPNVVVGGTGSGNVGTQPVGGIRTQSTMAVGLQPNALIQLGAGGTLEFVRVISVSTGPGGISSFRCVTVNTQTAGASLVGVGSFRAFFANTHAAAEALVDNVFATAVSSGLGWVQIVSPFNLTEISGQALQETDNISVALRSDVPANMTEVKILFDVDSATNDFNHNYFYATLRVSDMQGAVNSTQTQLAARVAAITRTITQFYQRAPGRPFGPVTPDTNTLGLPSGSAGDSLFAPGGVIGTSGQAVTGASQWSEFTFKVSDLVRVGADLTRTLANVAAIRIQWNVTAVTNVNVGDLWCGGTFGPDIGTTGSPIFYRSRGRSTVTGVVSLAGPPTRNSVEPHNQSVVVSGRVHPNPSCNLIDVFRWGSTLLQWTYVGSVPNVDNWIFLDVLYDTDIANNPLLDVDVFQPFPTIDLPRSGICNVVGTKVINVSGDTFNPSWYPGSQIQINGLYYTLYAQPPGDGTLEIVENGSTQTGVQFFMNQATLLAQPLPAFWGPYAEGTAAFGFGCGDTSQPGVLWVLRGNDMDSAPDTQEIEATSPSEPLINGCMYGATPYMWSSDKFYVLTPNLGSTVTSPTLLDPNPSQLFIPYPVAGSKGLFAQFCFCVGDAIYYRSKSGIEASNGSSSQSITDEDLSLLFGHDGQPGQPVTIGTITFNPPDDTKLNNQRLSFVDGFVYFDYIDTAGAQRTMVYNAKADIWGVDDYTPQVLIHYGDEGPGVHAMILGGNNGLAYLGQGIVDGNGNPFPCEARMPQLSELIGQYTVPYEGILGLQASQSGDISLVVNVDGVDNLVSVPCGTSYLKPYTRTPAVKGKILAFGLVSTFPFSLMLRDCQFQVGLWGREEVAHPVNPFSSVRRPTAPKVG